MSRRAIARTVGLAALALAGVNHVHGHQLYLDLLDVNHTLLDPAPIPAASGPHGPDAPVPPAHARRLWVVMIDGLRDDLADGVPAIAALAARGVRRRLEAEFPSYTLPNITTMATGLPPLYSGVRLNSGKRFVRVETLLDVAARHRTTVAIDREWPNYDRALDRTNAPGLPHLAAAAMPALFGEGRAMAWIFFEPVDEAGHSHGAASPQYRAAAERAGELLGRVAALLDPERDVLVALSDHGHRDRGGHGGVEPEARSAFFLAIGKGIRPGARLADARMRDVAPTLALLAGLPPPADSLGTPMIDLLSVPPDEAALAPAIAQRFGAEDRLRAALARRGARIDPIPKTDANPSPTAAPRSLAALADIESARDRSVAELFARRLPLRLAAGVGLALVPLLLVVVAHRRGALRLRLADHLPLVVYLGLFHAGYLLLGYRMSWSIGRGIARFLIETGVLGFVAGYIALRVGRLGGRGTSRRVEEAATTAWLWIAYILAAAVEGPDTRYMHDPNTSWLVIYIATSAFYFAICVGLAALRSPGVDRAAAP